MAQTLDYNSAADSQYIPYWMINAIKSRTGIVLSHQWTRSQGLALHTACGYLLGFMLSVGICALFMISSFSDSPLFPFILYLITSSLFYSLEYIWHSLFHPDSLSVSAFILFDHSPQFYMALIGCCIEYVIEYWLCPSWKLFGFYHFCGVMLVIGGQFIRSLAQFTAGSNFTHLVATKKRTDHILITHGIYSVLRHPSYFGYFYWAIGTQIMMGNPVCTVGYAIATYYFFKSRIQFEEAYLLDFFQNQYVEYKQNTIVGIPFIG